MARQHHRLNGCEFEQTPGDSEGQGSLVCHSPWCGKELDMTQWLNNNNTEHHGLGKPTLNMGRTLTLAYSWAKMI